MRRFELSLMHQKSTLHARLSHRIYKAYMLTAIKLKQDYHKVHVRVQGDKPQATWNNFSAPLGRRMQTPAACPWIHEIFELDASGW